MKLNTASAARCATAMLLVMLTSATSAATTKPEPELLEAEKAFQLSGRMRDDRTIEVRYLVADGYYMYRDRFRFEINGKPLKLTTKQFPPGKIKQDATFGKVVTYRNSVHLLLPVSKPGKTQIEGAAKDLVLKITSQGCADAGVCYPPLHQQLALALGSSAIVTPGETNAGSFSRPAGPAGSISDLLKRN
ncbi:MAG: protein-disulfide reductase DsbD N-terminal domain-containing protein [Betaproteobacteria bacterium]|nr:protein-disulfide reductase DsbD N-terminal domain-containing protein [Betaproteobacteria bacterium]